MSFRGLMGVLVGVLLLGCESTDEASSSFADASFAVQQADGTVVNVASLSEVEAELPFELPQVDLPDGASFASLTVVLPPESLDAGARERLTIARAFAGMDDSGLFQLDASIAGSNPAGGSLSSVAVGQDEGLLLDDGNTAALSWRSCDVGYLLAYDPNMLPSDIALEVASSIADSC